MFESVRRMPLLSTLCAAIFLAGCWTIFWLVVFFVSTWVLGYETGPTAFILAFWLSVGAEAVIRWLENTDFVAFYGKPFDASPKGDNQDFQIAKAALCLCLLIIFAALYLFLSFAIPDVFGIAQPNFAGQPERSLKGFLEMLTNWWNGVFSASVSLSIVAGFIFRVAIYKRSHKAVLLENQ